MTMPQTRALLGRPHGCLHHPPERLRAMGPRRVARLVEKHEAWGTAVWAAEQIFDKEGFSDLIAEPGVGLGVLADAAGRHGYRVVASDVFHWGYRRLDRLVDFLSPEYEAFLRSKIGKAPVSFVFNPPFTKTCAFVSQAKALGAVKIAAFGKMEFLGTESRRPWLEKNPPSRIWLCGTRATCWRFDVPPERQRGSTPTLHAWFVWERGHTGDTTIRNIWESE